MCANYEAGGSYRQGVRCRWIIQRLPRWATGEFERYELRGMEVLVEPMDMGKRQLLLEFAIDGARHGDMPQHQRFNLRDAIVVKAIEGALDAGWDPASRGKAFRHEAGGLQKR